MKNKNIVFGATGMVGGFIADHLTQEKEEVVAVSRSPRGPGRVDWIMGDMTRPETINLPKADCVFCAANARVFARAIHQILRAAPRRVLVISSTSIFSKIDSDDEAERKSISELVEAEQSIIQACEANGTEWTILRPTLIYLEGRDRNITQIAKLVRKLRFMPLYGQAGGLRQPVHAEDLALGAVRAARATKAANMAYCTSGVETIPYREMVGRIFDSMRMPRRLVSFPPFLWEAAFAAARPFYPWVTTAMGQRMEKDLAFDSSAAKTDFGWECRPFAPSF